MGCHFFSVAKDMFLGLHGFVTTAASSQQSPWVYTWIGMGVELTSESCNGQATPEQSQIDELEGAAVQAFPKTLAQRSQSRRAHRGMSLAHPGHAFVLATPYPK